LKTVQGIQAVLFHVNFSTINKRPILYKHENTRLEIIWTVIPTITLLLIAIPSLSLLFLLQPEKSTQFTIKVIGNQ
jgi:heme/copper-type cytochrome/quinol oxidase subunit 2